MKMRLLLAFAFTVPAAFATSFFIRPFSEFTKTTANIIRGKLHHIHVESGTLPDGGKTIYTMASLDIKDVIKGNISGSQIQVRKLGGSKDGVTLEIPSSVEFKENEESVFFLGDENEDHTYEVTGMELGRFDIVKKNGEEILEGGIFDYSKPHSGHDHQNDVLADDLSENRRPWSIQQLKDLVRSQQISQPAPAPDVQKNQEITNSSITTPSATPSSETPRLEAENNNLTHHNNSPLYFNSTLWYVLATIILTLGVILFFRRG